MPYDCIISWLLNACRSKKNVFTNNIKNIAVYGEDKKQMQQTATIEMLMM